MTTDADTTLRVAVEWPNGKTTCVTAKVPHALAEQVAGGMVAESRVEAYPPHAASPVPETPWISDRFDVVREIIAEQQQEYWDAAGGDGDGEEQSGQAEGGPDGEPTPEGHVPGDGAEDRQRQA